MAKAIPPSTERFVVYDPALRLMVVMPVGVPVVTLVQDYDFHNVMLDDFTTDRLQGYWLKVPEAARYVGCTPANIYLEINKGKLRAKRVGEHWYIWASWFNDWQRERLQAQSAA